MRAHLLVLAKAPVPGRVKTRLSPALPPRLAAAVARAALLDTLTAVSQVPAVRRTLVLDGAPDGWLPGAWYDPAGGDVVPQTDGDLGARLAGAFAGAFQRSTGPTPVAVMLVGMDTPQITAGELDRAVDALLAPGTDAVLGPAEDGGWWALGLRRPAPTAFAGVPMSTEHTGAHQQARLAALGLRTTLLPTARDIDHVEDVAAVAALQRPDAELARLARRLDLLAPERAA